MFVQEIIMLKVQAYRNHLLFVFEGKKAL